MNTKNWKALFIHFLNHKLKLNENQANTVLDNIKNKYIKFVFHNDDNKIIKIDENLKALKNMLINQGGLFFFNNDKIEMEPIK